MNLVYLTLLSCVILLGWGCEAVNCSEYQGGSAMSALRLYIIYISLELWDLKCGVRGRVTLEWRWISFAAHGSVDYISAVGTVQSGCAPHGASTLVLDFHHVRFSHLPSPMYLVNWMITLELKSF